MSSLGVSDPDVVACECFLHSRPCLWIKNFFSIPHICERMSPISCSHFSYNFSYLGVDFGPAYSSVCQGLLENVTILSVVSKCDFFHTINLQIEWQTERMSPKNERIVFFFLFLEGQSGFFKEPFFLTFQTLALVLF